MRGPISLRRLPLHGAERSELSLSVDQSLHGAGPEGPDQFVLQVDDADVEAQQLHPGPRQIGPDSGPLQTTKKAALFCDIAETGQPDVESLRAQQRQKVPDLGRTTDGYHGNAFGAQITTTTSGQGLDRRLVTDPLNEHDRARADAGGQGGAEGDGRRPILIEPGLVLHVPQLGSGIGNQAPIKPQN
jgi:hypothetical protein